MVCAYKVWKKVFNSPPYRIEVQDRLFFLSSLKKCTYGVWWDASLSASLLHRPGVDQCSWLPNSPRKQNLSTQKIPSRGTDFWDLVPSVDFLTSKNSLLSCLFTDAFMKILFLILPPTFSTLFSRRYLKTI